MCGGVSNLCTIFALKLTGQRDMLNSELSQVTAKRGNIENDEYRRLQAENAALKRSLGGRKMRWYAI